MPLDSTDWDGQPSDHETKPDVFSLAGLIAWLKTQDPATEYCFIDGTGEIGGCLWHRYFMARGFKNVYVFSGGVCADDTNWTFPGNSSPYASGTVVNQIGSGHPRTFGAALKRAESCAMGMMK